MRVLYTKSKIAIISYIDEWNIIKHNKCIGKHNKTFIY